MCELNLLDLESDVLGAYAQSHSIVQSKTSANYLKCYTFMVGENVL
jgi:hypothetical protein